jgi:hypothetical protein
MALTVETAQRKGGNKTVSTVASPIEFLLEKEQLAQRGLVKTESKELVVPFPRFRGETPAGLFKDGKTFQHFPKGRRICLRLGQANGNRIGIAAHRAAAVEQAFKYCGAAARKRVQDNVPLFRPR